MVIFHSYVKLPEGKSNIPVLNKNCKSLCEKSPEGFYPTGILVNEPLSFPLFWVNGFFKLSGHIQHLITMGRAIQPRQALENGFFHALEKPLAWLHLWGLLPPVCSSRHESWSGSKNLQTNAVLKTFQWHVEQVAWGFFFSFGRSEKKPFLLPYV